MRIIYFIDGLVAGGKERRLSQLMLELKSFPEINFELVVMKQGIYYKKILSANIRIHYLLRGTKKDFTVFKKFKNLCKEFKPDIVHCWDSMTAIYALPACRSLKIKLVNGMVVDTPVQRNIFNKHWFRAKLSFHFSDMIIGNSKAGLKAYSAPVNKSLCIYNGMNLSRFSNLPDRDKIFNEVFGDENKTCFIVGMVAAFENRKDYSTLINTAIEIIQEDTRVRFVLIGDGENLDLIKAMVPASLTGRIVFLGNKTDVESYIQIFDVGVLLTNSKVHGEGISNSILEYMASGKPVIATSGGGTNELISEGKDGFIIESGSVSALKEKIRILLDDPHLKNAMGHNGYQKVQQFFDIKIMTQKMLDMYESLMKKKTSV